MAQPVFSSDDMHSDKHKMERFLHGGRGICASVYAPVTYGPMPMLAFRLMDGIPRLAFTGAHFYERQCCRETHSTSACCRVS